MDVKINEGTQFDLYANTGKYLSIIRKAGAKHSTITLTYMDANNRQTVRTVEPYEIKDGKLFAFCISKQSIRAFKLDRIQNVQTTGMSFQPRYPLNLGSE